MQILFKSYQLKIQTHTYKEMMRMVFNSFGEFYDTLNRISVLKNVFCGTKIIRAQERFYFIGKNKR